MWNENAIAIIGFSGQFPGSQTIDEFWKNLFAEKELITHFPQSESNMNATNISESSNEFYVRSRGVLNKIDEFDANFFNYTENEALLLDPQIRLFLEHSWTALELSGYAPTKVSQLVGVYASMPSSDYFFKYLQPNLNISNTHNLLPKYLSTDPGFLSTTISYRLNLTGPSLNINTACSSSLVCIANACQQLVSYECDMALAGGSSIRLPQDEGYYYVKEGIFSPDGHCRAFDEKASGTVPSGGVGVVVLKRLSDAIKDKDTIYAVITGYAVNNDGHQKVNFSAPSVQGQSDCIALAQAIAEVEPHLISYIEAHGTGTVLGDAVELKALNKVFGSCLTHSIPIGSVKTNIGHADLASGMAGLFKVIFSLKESTLPASLHYDKPSVYLKDTPFYVNQSTCKWPAVSERRIAGVSSFGIGGTNAHLIVEQYKKSSDHQPTCPLNIISLSAKTKEALIQKINDLIIYFEEYSLNKKSCTLTDIAYTLHVGREDYPYRLSLICNNNITHTIELLKNSINFTTSLNLNDTPNKVLFFLDYDLSFIHYCQSIYETCYVFTEMVNASIEIIKGKFEICLNKNWFDTNNSLSQSQIIFFVLQYSMFKSFEILGIEYQLITGVGIGHLSSLCARGLLEFEEAISLILNHSNLINVNTALSKKEEAIKLINGFIHLDINKINFLNQRLDLPISNVVELIELAQHCTTFIGYPDFFVTYSNSSISIEETYCYLGSSLNQMSEEDSGIKEFYNYLSNHWSKGFSIKWENFYEKNMHQRVALPTYPFQRKRYWPDLPSINTSQSSKLNYKSDSLPVNSYYLTWETKQSVISISDKTHCWEIYRKQPKIWILICTSHECAEIFLNQLKDINQKAIYLILDENLEKSITEIIYQYGHVDEFIYYLDKNSNHVENYQNLIKLIQLFQQMSNKFNTHIHIISSMLFPINIMNNKVDPEASMFIGIAKTCHQEIRNLYCSLYDLADEALTVQSTNILLNEMIYNSYKAQNVITAYRNHQFWTQSPQQFDIDQALKMSNSRTLLKKEGVYIITGGCGQLGLMLADYLAIHYRANLILTTRNDILFESHGNTDVFHEINLTKNKKKQLEKLKKIKKSASALLIKKVDTSNLEEMQRMFEESIEKYGKINGIFHLAADTKSAYTLIKYTNPKTTELQFKPKIAGTQVLAKCLHLLNYDFCLLFSSLSTFIGGIGYTDYIAANAFLDNFVYQDRADIHKKWLCINSDGWNFDISDYSIEHFSNDQQWLTPDDTLPVIDKLVNLLSYKQVFLSKRDLAFFTQPPKDPKDQKQAAHPYHDSHKNISASLISQNNEIEERIKRIFSKELGISNIDLDQKLDQLCSDSIIIIILINEIEKEFNINLNIQIFYTLQNTRQLIDYITNKKLEYAPSSLVLLKEGGDDALFIFHPVGGTLFCYQELILHLDNRYTIYGLQNPTLHLDVNLFPTFDSLANYYVNLICKQQPHGPYRFLGLSLGGNMAHAVAAKFESKGERVSYIGMIDSWSKFPAQFKKPNMFKQSSRHVINMLLKELPTELKKTREKLESMIWSSMNALIKYDTPIINNNIFLYKAKNLLPEYKSIESTDNHWSVFSHANIYVNIVPGDHISIISPPYVKDLAKIINQDLYNNNY